MEALLRAGAEQMDDLADHETLPRRADLGVRDDVLAAGEAKQRVEKAGIFNVDPRRAHLALVHVLVPRLQLARHEDGRKQVQ